MAVRISKNRSHHLRLTFGLHNVLQLGRKDDYSIDGNRKNNANQDTPFQFYIMQIFNFVEEHTYKQTR